VELDLLRRGIPSSESKQVKGIGPVQSQSVPVTKCNFARISETGILVEGQGRRGLFSGAGVGIRNSCNHNILVEVDVYSRNSESTVFYSRYCALSSES
jgi:hypothetical protein